MARKPWPTGRFEKPSQSSGFLLWQATNGWQRKIKACLAPFNLTHVQFVLLAGLCWLGQSEENCDITQKRLAQHCVTDPMMTSQVLRTLERDGLVIRRQHCVDGRAWQLELTDLGHKKLEEALPSVEATDAAFFGALGLRQSDFAECLVEIVSVKK